MTDHLNINVNMYANLHRETIGKSNISSRESSETASILESLDYIKRQTTSPEGRSMMGMAHDTQALYKIAASF